MAFTRLKLNSPAPGAHTAELKLIQTNFGLTLAASASRQSPTRTRISSTPCSRKRKIARHHMEPNPSSSAPPPPKTDSMRAIPPCSVPAQVLYPPTALSVKLKPKSRQRLRRVPPRLLLRLRLFLFPLRPRPRKFRSISGSRMPLDSSVTLKPQRTKGRSSKATLPRLYAIALALPSR